MISYACLLGCLEREHTCIWYGFFSIFCVSIIVRMTICMLLPVRIFQSSPHAMSVS